MASNAVPFLDLVSPHQALKNELIAVCSEVLDTGRFIGGSMVEEFEKEFAGFCETKHCIAVNSGTDALRFAFIAAGVMPGDIMLTVPNTFIATTEAISQAGATAEFIDIDEKSYTMSPDKLRQFLLTRCIRDQSSGRTLERRSGRPVTALVPVHLYGQPADMDTIAEIAEEYKLMVFEDACQAHGAEYFSRRECRWKKAGSLGLAAAFSFYPGKNLGACGEGGAVTTSDDRIARTVRMLRDHGQQQKYYHEIEGYNGRLDALQAGFLRVKLQRLPQWNELRRTHAQRYNDLLSILDDVVIPHQPSWAKSVYHLYVIRVPEREQVQKLLAEKGVHTALHYPVPLHLQKAYTHRGYQAGDFPAAEKAATEILSLPMFPELTDDQQRRVAEELALSLVLSRVADETVA